MIKKLLITILISLSFLGISFAQVPFEVDQFPVDVTGFIDVDGASTITVAPDTNEISMYSDVVVRILDNGNNPVSGHTVTLYANGNPASVTFIQPSSPSDADGYVYGKVRSTAQGAYVIKAIDTTYSQDINLQDTADFYTFPLPTPTMQQEPQYTKGLTNTVFWNYISGMSPSYEYYVEMSKASTFAVIEANSGWISTNSHQFTGLTGNQMYFFRVMARNSGGGQSGYSNIVFSVQDNIPPVIKYVDIERLSVDDKVSAIEVVFDVTDNFVVNKVEFFCKLQNGELDVCGDMSNVGSRYTVNIPLNDLEKGPFGTYFENYQFCVYAYDKAGNSVNNCEFNIDVAAYIDTDNAIFNNIINAIIKYLNDSLSEIGSDLKIIFSQAQEIILQLISLLLILLVIIVSLSIIASGLFAIPTLILGKILSLFRFIGIRKKGKYIGYVYDSISGKRVKYAKIEIYDGSNVLIHTDVTNKFGEFFGDIDAGKYRIVTKRSHYLSPSLLYKEYTLDKKEKIYVGEYILVSSSNPLNVAIPIDPINIYASWEKQNAIEKRINNLMKAVIFLLMTFGLAISIVTFEKYQNIINLILCLIYIPVFGVYLKSVVKMKIFVKK